VKADLHQDILKLIKKKKFTPRQLEKLFDIPQPRVSELLRGKLSLLSVSKLLYYAIFWALTPRKTQAFAVIYPWKTRQASGHELSV